MRGSRKDEDEFHTAPVSLGVSEDTTTTTTTAQVPSEKSQDRLMSVMNVTSLNASLIEQVKTTSGDEVGGSRAAKHKQGVNVITAPVTTTLIRFTLLGVILYQSKFLKLFACLILLGVFLLTVWLLTRQAPVEHSSTTATTIATTTLSPFEPSEAPTEAANKTLLLVDIDAFSLLGDMTVPNHVLDIDSFPD